MLRSQPTQFLVFEIYIKVLPNKFNQKPTKQKYTHQINFTPHIGFIWGGGSFFSWYLVGLINTGTFSHCLPGKFSTGSYRSGAEVSIPLTTHSCH